ncbi:hypothetical protein B0J18DRAFT_436698 [Chaetomium sp. MPI-SDFR-AT-0129]|nr:hypothetical protein B0J18DRAFT_436698 [Chaetomium sp. MPI-SDFR-AT-0129]
MLQRRLPRTSRNWNPSLRVAVAPGSDSKFLFLFLLLFRFFRVQLSRSRPSSIAIFQLRVCCLLLPQRVCFFDNGEFLTLIPNFKDLTHSEPIPQFLIPATTRDHCAATPDSSSQVLSTTSPACAPRRAAPLHSQHLHLICRPAAQLFACCRCRQRCRIPPSLWCVVLVHLRLARFP